MAGIEGLDGATRTWAGIDGAFRERGGAAVRDEADPDRSHPFRSRRSKGPTWEASLWSRSVKVAATISPVSASTPKRSFFQDRRVRVPCFSTSHSPAPQGFGPVLSTGGYVDPAPPPAASSAPRAPAARLRPRHVQRLRPALRAVWFSTRSSSPSRRTTEPISPSVRR